MHTLVFLGHILAHLPLICLFSVVSLWSRRSDTTGPHACRMQYLNTKWQSMHYNDVTEVYYTEVTEMYYTEVTEMYYTEVTEMYYTEVTEMYYTEVTEVHDHCNE